MSSGTNQCRFLLSCTGAVDHTRITAVAVFAHGGVLLTVLLGHCWLGLAHAMGLAAQVRAASSRCVAGKAQRLRPTRNRLRQPGAANGPEPPAGQLPRRTQDQW